MISLHVYITPKKGRDLDLKKAICDYWLPAMQKQPGFINAALLNPFATSELKLCRLLSPNQNLRLYLFGVQNNRDWNGLIDLFTTKFSRKL